MKIVVLYQYYQGHGSPGHSLIYELSQFLANRGHDVTVVSGETGYMQTDMPSLSWYKRFFRRENDGQVKVIRTYTYTELHRSYLGRLFSFISFSLSCPLGLFSVDKPDVLLASSPPIFPVFTAWLICKIRGIPFVFEVRDLWPESAIQMGILKNRQLISIMRWMEHILYNQSSKIISLTEGIKSDIITRGWPENKIKTITCGVDFDLLYPDTASSVSIRQKYGWVDKNVILYFGAMGEANNLDVIIRSALRLSHREDIIFVIVGDGMMRNEMENNILDLNLKNIFVLPPVPKEEARAYINSADICLATLKDINIFDGAIPTKLIDYMACGKVVLCGIRGEAARIVEESDAGIVFDPNNDEQLCFFITNLLSDPNKIKQMGLSGYYFVKERFSALQMRHQMETILLEFSKQ